MGAIWRLGGRTVAGGPGPEGDWHSASGNQLPAGPDLFRPPLFFIFSFFPSFLPSVFHYFSSLPPSFLPSLFLPRLMRLWSSVTCSCPCEGVKNISELAKMSHIILYSSLAGLPLDKQHKPKGTLSIMSCFILLLMQTSRHLKLTMLMCCPPLPPSLPPPSSLLRG